MDTLRPREHTELVPPRRASSLFFRRPVHLDRLRENL